MKKRILLIICPILVVAIAIGIYFFMNRKISFDVSAENWAHNGSFLLGTFAVDSVNNSVFIPENEAEFLDAIEKNVSYIGKRNYPYLGISNNECHFFSYNNGIYALMKWNEAAYDLVPCKTNFSTYMNETMDYAYPSPGEFYPKWEEKCYTLDNSWDFEYVFGNYEDATTEFYCYFSDDIVTFDSEKQIIRCHPYCYTEGQIDTEKWVVLDFINKTVGFDFGEEES